MTTIKGASQPKIETATLTIAIGRNVMHERIVTAQYFGNIVQCDAGKDDGELTDTPWILFGQDIIEVVGYEPNVITTGRGEYAGTREECAVMSWYDSNPLTARQLLRLASIRDAYGQESIAVTFASPSFI
jgi:hypothetical protein